MNPAAENGPLIRSSRPDAGEAAVEVRVPDAVLEDLRDRLGRSRYLAPVGDDTWAGGLGGRRLRELVEGWRRFDWRAEEARLNRHEHGLADVGGHRLHYVRIPAVGPGRRIPILLLHGWPSAFVEYIPLGERLADPARWGGGDEIAFEVIIPSLPGFVFSDLTPLPVTRRAMAEALHSLMTTVLGHERYATFGGDIGGGASTWIGADHPESLIGIQLLNPPFPADDTPQSDEEREFLGRLEEYDRADGGYSEIMITRPDTIAAALQDSPAGLLAWIADKWHDWVDDSFDDVVASGILYSIATLYWATGSIRTSFQQYVDWGENPPRPLIEAPVGVYLSREPGFVGFPRSLSERAASDIREFVRAPAGGHFAGFESPDATAQAVRGFFRSLD